MDEIILSDKNLINYILKYCVNKEKYILLTGTGCAGKTTLSLKLALFFEQHNISVNCIHMDDFLSNSHVRYNSVKYWEHDGELFSGRFTSCCAESYYLAATEAVLYAVKNKKFQYIKTKSGEFDIVNGRAQITIIEGLGVPFLNDTTGLKIFLECSESVELQRRIIRDSERLKRTENEIKTNSVDRRLQYEQFVLPYKDDCELVLKSNDNFSLSLITDKLGIIK